MDRFLPSVTLWILTLVRQGWRWSTECREWIGSGKQQREFCACDGAPYHADDNARGRCRYHCSQHRAIPDGRPGPDAGRVVSCAGRHAHAQGARAAGGAGRHRHQLLHPHAYLLPLSFRARERPLLPQPQGGPRCPGQEARDHLHAHQREQGQRRHLRAHPLRGRRLQGGPVRQGKTGPPVRRCVCPAAATRATTAAMAPRRSLHCTHRSPSPVLLACST